MFKEANHYHFSVDSKGRDFVVYNADSFFLSDDEITDNDLSVFQHKDTILIAKLKSETWSSSCKFFFVIQDEGIYLFNVHNNDVLFCKKHTQKIFELYLSVKK